MSLIGELDEARILVEEVEDFHIKLEDAQRFAIDHMDSIEDSETESIAGQFQGLDTDNSCRRCMELLKAHSDSLKKQSWDSKS